MKCAPLHAVSDPASFRLRNHMDFNGLRAVDDWQERCGDTVSAMADVGEAARQMMLIGRELAHGYARIVSGIVAPSRLMDGRVWQWP